MKPYTPAFSTEDIHKYHRVVSSSVLVRTHFDVLVWLQGDMQHYLPHDIMIAAWGNFEEGTVQHDIISPLAGVRSQNSNAQKITPLLLKLFRRWNEFGRKPFAINAGESGFLLDDSGLKCELGAALKKMHCAMIHGINDERGSHNCLYITFSTMNSFNDIQRSAMGAILPYVDSALRQVAHLPHQAHLQTQHDTEPLDKSLTQSHDLSIREAEVMFWVALGKTNPEIGCILSISGFTVKNHMQRVLKKLDVINRAQAVAKFKELCH